MHTSPPQPIPTLARLSPFKALAEPERNELISGTRVLRENRGRLLVQKGDRIPGAYLVVEGVLRIYSMNAAGKEATLYRLRAGEVCLLSLNAVFSGARYPAWVSVESASVRVAVMPGIQIRRIFSRSSAMQDLILSSLTSTVSELLIQLDQVLLSSLRERILSFVERNADEKRCLSVTHQNLADHLGVTREAISRELSALAREHVLSTGRGRIRLRG